MMNKVSLSPFALSNLIGSPKDVPATPRLLSKHKNYCANVNKLRITKKEGIDNQEILHFDDSFCFRENNRQVSAHQTSRDKMPQTKKCLSQLLNVKMMDNSSPKIRQKSNYEHSSPQISHKTKQYPTKFDPFSEFKPSETQPKKTDRNYTSYSSRKKYQTIKVQPSADLPFEHNKSQGGICANNSTLVVDTSPQYNQTSSPLRTKFRHKYHWQTNPANPIKSDRNLDQLPEKKINFYQYSIIKPDQIKSLTLLQRKEEKQIIENRRRQQKLLYLETLHQMKKKQELTKRNAKLKEQILLSCKKRVKNTDHRRHKWQNPPQNIRKCVSIEQKNELRPWDVELNSTQTPFIDIL